MSKEIEVLLLEDIPALGQAGEIISVNEGHARNFLFPEGKAAVASTEVKAKKAREETKRAQTQQAELEQKQQLAEALEGTELTLTARVKDGTEIFGSITAAHIAEALQEQAKLTVTPKQIGLEEPLREIGSQDVEIQLSPEVSATIRVTITALPDTSTSHEEA